MKSSPRSKLRDAQRATTALGMLRAHAPDDAHLPTLEFLTRALTEWRAPVADPHALAAAARRLDVDIAPAARARIGTSAAGRFVGAFFR